MYISEKINMGQENSKQLFVHLLVDTLKVRGIKEGKQQLLQVLQYVKDVCRRE